MGSSIDVQKLRSVGNAETDAASRVLKFVFSTSDIARDGHRILPGAWDLTNFLRNPVFLIDHRLDKLPIGRVVDIAERHGRLEGAVRFAETAEADEVFKLYKDGILHAVSVQWIPIDWKPGAGPDRRPGAKDFVRCDLLEVSAVSVPADPAALVQRAARAEAARAAIASGRYKLPPAEPRSREPEFRDLGAFLHATLRHSQGVPDPRLARAPAGLAEVDPPFGGFLVPESLATEVVESLYAESVIAPLCRRVETPLPFTQLTVDESSREDGNRHCGVLAGFVAEGEAPPLSITRYRAVKLGSTKLIAALYATNELLADGLAAPDSLCRVLASEAGFVLDRKILHGLGTGAEPLGILNSPALITVEARAGQSPGTVVKENLEDMWYRLPVPCRKRATWILGEDGMAALDRGNFSNVHIPAGQAGNATPLLYGRPVIETEHGAPLGTVGDIVLADLTQYVIASPGPAVSVSAHVGFLNDESVIRFVWRLDATPLWSASITSASGASTRSPFITLAAR